MKGTRPGFRPLFPAALVFLCAGLVGCASGGGGAGAAPHIAPPAAERPQSSAIRQLPAAQRREVAAALNTRELNEALGEHATSAPLGVSHNPKILDTNPFLPSASSDSAPLARSAPVADAVARSEANPAPSAAYKAFEIPYPAQQPLMTIAVWIADDPAHADPSHILMRLQVHISPESLVVVAQNGGIEKPEDQNIAVQVSPAQPEPEPEPFDAAKCAPKDSPENERSPSDLAWDLAGAIDAGDRQKVCDLVRGGAQTAGAQFVSGVSALHDVILKGDDGVWLEIAEILIVNGADLNHAGSDGRGPLHWAARRNATGLLALLLENGADLNARAKNGFSALDDAAEGGRRAPEAAKMLVDSGGICYVNTDSPLCEGAHPPDFLAGPECPAGTMSAEGKKQAALDEQLRLAARAGETERICEWLRRGANINDTVDGAEESVVHEAARGGHLEAVELLLANGAEVNLRKEGKGPSPLDIAAQDDDDKVAAVLRNAGGLCFLETGPLCRDEPEVPEVPEIPEVPEVPEVPEIVADKCPASSLPANGLSEERLGRELFLAVMYTTGLNWGEDKRTEICDWIRRGADINQSDSFIGHLMPLHLPALGIAGAYSAELAEFLMANGADPNGRSWDGDTPLHVAARVPTPEVLKALAAGGGDVNAGNNRARTPLHEAALWGQAEIVGILAGLGANVNALDENNRTPMHSAANQARVETVEALLSHGADLFAEDNSGRTPRGSAEHAWWTGERNVYVLEVFTHLRVRNERLQRIMAILQAAEDAAEDSPVAAEADGGALAGRFASSFAAGPAFGDMFGEGDLGEDFTSRLHSLMHHRGGAGEQAVAGGSGAWFSTGRRGDFGFGAGGDSEWGGAGLTGSPYALLAGSGMQAGGAAAFGGGSGQVRFAAFGDFERGEFSRGFGGWAARGAGVGEEALRAAEGFSAIAGGRMRSGGALAEIHHSGGLGEFAVQAGAISESGSFLSGVSRGEDLRGLRSRTAFAGVSGAAELGGGWRFRGSAHLGRSRAFSDGILLQGEAWSSSFAAGLERGDWLYSGDGVILRVSQPLRVERWEMELAGAGWAPGGSGPSGRQLDVDAAYRLPLVGGGRALFSAGVRSGRGHAADSGVEGAALFSVERGF